MNTKTLIEIIENISNPEKGESIDQTVKEDLRNTELSLVDRAVIDAYLLQQSGKIVDAIEKWRSIANVAEGIDNELAAQAWFSVGSLLSESEGDPEDALFAYDKAIILKPDNAVYHNNRGATKIPLRAI